ncbi:MFS general substrate transporter [Auricularia subglabra TFB-10046 SS5]|uniref:MFS general substrate transporter n=1 Tax=Auricularia subglabra (strain TFB-10046 / SS5) TaxID=717982 RepID=J0DCJ6_AURST|nr:MFS general substrate transporter [Auricularia subglabra TFB-10046 SS5]
MSGIVQSSPEKVKDDGQSSARVEASVVDPSVQALEHRDTCEDDEHVDLTWRSWVVVATICFAIFTQVYVVVAAASVIAFIIRDLGNAPLAGWVIQGPLLVQSALSPIIGRLSDVLDRKYLAALPPLVAFAGAVVSARAESMQALVGGGILIGFTLSTTAITQAVPSEVLPLKWRPLANGFAGVSSSISGVFAILGAGAVTNANPGGWRTIFWIQAGLHLATSLGILLFYWPKRLSDYPRLALRNAVWACDPVGCATFIVSTTLLLISLDWAGTTFPWHDAHVAAPLTIGLVLLATFCVYEWKGRSDGLVAHVFFNWGPNFPLAIFGMAVEGWVFYSAVNSIVPQIVLNVGFESNAFRISIRQLSYQVPVVITPAVSAWYATRYKDLKSPLLFTFSIFLIATICYATIQPSFDKPQQFYNVLSGIGVAGPLTLLPALVQFTSPHEFLSTATGLAFSIRAIGGAFGTAILNAIINGHLAQHYALSLEAAGADAGMVARIQAGNFTGVPQAVLDASHRVYARAYRLAWASIIPFVVLVILAVLCLRGVAELMTERVEATVERSEEEASSDSMERKNTV